MVPPPAATLAAHLRQTLTRRPLVALLLLGLAVRAIYLLEVGNTLVFNHLVGDGYVYDRWAQKIAGGDWLGDEIFYQAPLYPYFLASLYTLAGHSPLLVRIVQMGLVALSCVLLALAGRRFFEDRRVGLLAGGLLAVYAPALFFEGLVQKPALDLFWVSLALFLLGEQRHRGTLGWLPAAGLVLGLLSLTRESALVLIPLVALWCLLPGEARPRGRRALGAALLLAGVALPLLAVGLRNQAVGGEFLLTTSNFGSQLYIGNGDRATGEYVPLVAWRGSALLEREDAVALAERARGRALSPAEVSAYWTGRTLDHIAAHPGRWLALMAKKWAMVWNRREIIDTESPAIYREQSLLLRALWPLFNFGTLVPLALLGAVACWGQRRRLWLLYLATLALAASVALFFIFARYRFAMVPLLLLFAATGIWALVDAWRARADARRPLWVRVGLVALFALAVNWPLGGDADSGATGYYNLGVALQWQDKRRAAERAFAQALSRRPDLVPAHVNQALLLARRGQLARAEHHLRRAVTLQPGFGRAHFELARVLDARGDHRAARAHLERALRLDPALRSRLRR